MGVKVIASAVLAVGLLASGAAQAAVSLAFDTGPGVPAGTLTLLTDFNSNIVGAQAAPGTGYSFSGEGVVQTGSLSGVYGMPLNDDTKYLTVGSTTFTGPPGGTAVETLSLTTPGAIYTQFGLYWGSVDNYNSIAFYKGGTLVTGGLFTGSQISDPADGNQLIAATNKYVTFSFSGGDSFDKVVFTSTSAAFEFDNLGVFAESRTAPVPEASTWGMMILGFFGVGFMAYRRKRANSEFRFA